MASEEFQQLICLTDFIVEAFKIRELRTLHNELDQIFTRLFHSFEK